jgi:subtilase family protein
MRRILSAGTVLAVGLLGLAPVAASAATTTPAGPGPVAAAAPARADEAVIVVLRHQYSFPGTVAGARQRVAAGNAAQAQVVASLRASHAASVRQLHLIDAVAATVSPAEAAALAASGQVSQVVPDASFRGPAPVSLHGHAAARGAAKLAPGVCPPKGQVQLNPEGAELVHAFSASPATPTARKLGFTGAGVTVGDIAVGINPAEAELIRANGQRVIKDYQDFTGEGTTVYGGEDLESYLDDSVMAAQGRLVYDLHTYGLGMPQGCDIRLEGVAPGITLDAYKVYGNEDMTTTSAFLEAIDYAVDHDHVNVLNEEGGSFPMPDTSQDLIKTANAAAMAAGVTITSPSYDAGPQSTIWSPSSQPGVISVGASTGFRSYAQGDVGEYDQLHARGWVSDNISALSSGGFTERGATIDVLAPGDLDWVACGLDEAACGASGNIVTISGGTSEAGPIVAAVAALVIQAYRSTHHGATPSTAQVRDIISASADDLAMPGYEQGSGLVDAYRAVRAAMAAHHGTGGTGPNLVASVQQLSAAGAPGAQTALSFKLTNAGPAKAKVALASRAAGTSVVIAHRTLHRTDKSGDQVFTFKLPHNAAVLTADIADPGGPVSNPVALSLVNPQGQLAAYTLPQGTGNHGQAEVRQARAGVWKADVSSLGSYSGPVYVAVYAAPLHPRGQVTPARVTLAPGASTTVTLHTSLAAKPGDLSEAVTFGAPGWGKSSLPVTLRSLIPLRHGTGHFATTLVGGNGRGFVPAQTFFYDFNVPAGSKSLDVQAKLGGSNNDPFYAYLVDPQGDAVAQASNQVVVGETAQGTIVQGEPGARLHALAPPPGLWSIIITFTNPVNGNRLTTPLTGTVSLAPVTAKVTGLPDRAAAVLTQGSPSVVALTVRNTGDAAEAYFLDGRLDRSATMALTPISQATKITLPTTFVFPQWIVPTDSTSLTGTATSTIPTTFDMSPLNGEPDLGATVSGNDAAATVSAPAGTSLTQGDWDIIPQQVGPFGSGGAPTSTTSLAMSARTAAFDPAVSADTGDLWLQGAAAQAAFKPVLVQPGQTTTLYAVITPSAKVGTVVRGVLYLDDSSAVTNEGLSPSGDQLLAVPYTYTVGK